MNEPNTGKVLYCGTAISLRLQNGVPAKCLIHYFTKL